MRGFPVLKLPARLPHPNRGQGALIEDAQTVLFDLENDPGQTTPICDQAVEARLLREMGVIMQDHEAPIEAFERIGL